MNSKIRLYEMFSPNEIGLERKIVIGKHSENTDIISKLALFYVHIDDFTASRILSDVRKASISLKRSLTDRELLNIYGEYLVEKEMNLINV